MSADTHLTAEQREWNALVRARETEREIEMLAEKIFVRMSAQPGEHDALVDAAHARLAARAFIESRIIR